MVVLIPMPPARPERPASLNKTDADGSETTNSELPDLESATADKGSECSESLHSKGKPVVLIELSELSTPSPNPPFGVGDPALLRLLDGVAAAASGFKFWRRLADAQRPVRRARHSVQRAPRTNFRVNGHLRWQQGQQPASFPSAEVVSLVSTICFGPPKRSSFATSVDPTDAVSRPRSMGPKQLGNRGSRDTRRFDPRK
jgi:hypothetical protein